MSAGARPAAVTGARPAAAWAVLLDMDGLLVDSEPVWTVAEREIAKDLGGEFTPETKAAMIGQRLESAVPLLLSFIGTPQAAAADPLQVGARLLERMSELLGSAPQLMPGAGELLLGLAGAGVPTALVSSSYRRLVDAVLTGLDGRGGGHRFDATVAGDEVGEGKPGPEPYLTAADRLHVPPKRCVVLEDSIAGAQSGVAAGCTVVLVPSVPGVAASTESPAGVPSSVTVVASLTELSVERLAGLVGVAAG